MFKIFAAAVLLIAGARLHALELQGFLTKDCQRHLGIIIYADDQTVETMGLDGYFHSVPIENIDIVYAYNIIGNPFRRFVVDKKALSHLKAIYTEDTKQPRAVAFPVRYIEDLVIFYSLDGKTHVHRMNDIFKLRPAPESALGEHLLSSAAPPEFEFSDQSAKCPAATTKTPATKSIKPTRVLADKISIAEFIGSFAQGYDNLESFQERTYLYAKPYLFDKKARLGLVFADKREEPGPSSSAYFQWSTGEPYRFQSQTVIGSKNHEFTPTTEPVFSVRSDVKSHAFHALFIGNVAALPAGSAVFDGTVLELKKPLTVQPSFNYMALMGGDYGPYSLSGGFYYPTFGIKVGAQQREVLGREASYALRVMYTKPNYRLRVISSFTQYGSQRPTVDDVKVLYDEGTSEKKPVINYKFKALFVRGGIDYQFSPKLTVSLDGTLVDGNYGETALYNGSSALPGSVDFTKATVQMQVKQSFGDYVSLSAFVNFFKNRYASSMENAEAGGIIVPDKREDQGMHFFGTLEFIF
jgi:hypothetical protein